MLTSLDTLAGWLLMVLVTMGLIVLFVVVPIRVAVFVVRLSEGHRYDGTAKKTVRRGRPIGTLREAQGELDAFGPPGGVPDFLSPHDAYGPSDVPDFLKP